MLFCAPLRRGEACFTLEEARKKVLRMVAGHGGNECGVFKALNPKLDIITFGPKGTDVHTPNEKLNLDSFERSYQMLKDMVSACK